MPPAKLMLTLTQENYDLIQQAAALLGAPSANGWVAMFAVMRAREVIAKHGPKPVKPPKPVRPPKAVRPPKPLSPDQVARAAWQAKLAKIRADLWVELARQPTEYEVDHRQSYPLDEERGSPLGGLMDAAARAHEDLMHFRAKGQRLDPRWKSGPVRAAPEQMPFQLKPVGHLNDK